MITLSQEQIKRLHKRMVEATGGLDGLRDEDMLDSALSVGFQTFDGVDYIHLRWLKSQGLHMVLFVIIHFWMGTSVSALT